MCGIPIRDRTHYIIEINIVFGILALLALAIRMLVALQRHTFGYDDTCAVIAYLFAAPVTAGQVACGYLGFGKDTWAVPAANIYKIMKVGQVYLDVFILKLTLFRSCTLIKLFTSSAQARVNYASCSCFSVSFLINELGVLFSSESVCRSSFPLLLACPWFLLASLFLVSGNGT